MTDISIELATVKDVDTLWKWGDENWELWGDDKYKWFPKESLEAWVKDPEDDFFLVAKLNEKPVGMCMITVMKDWGFCWGLYIDTPFRGKGIGKVMITESEKRLKKQGISLLSLLVDVKNKKALSFYEREGFYKGFQFFMMTKEIKGEVLD